MQRLKVKKWKKSRGMKEWKAKEYLSMEQATAALGTTVPEGALEVGCLFRVPLFYQRLLPMSVLYTNGTERKTDLSIFFFS